MAKSQKQKKQSQAFEVWKRFRRNRLAVIGMCIFSIFLIMILFENQIAPQGINDQDFDHMLEAPSANFLFGTDQYGRDLFSRIVHGAKYSLSMGIVATAIAAIIGIPVGAIAGYYGGNTDNIIMRFLDIFMTMPMILMAIVLSTAFGSGIFNTMMAVGIAGAPSIARVTRSSIMSVKNQEFVEAAISNNATNARIIFKYLLPNALAPILVSITLYVAGAILAASSLSFLGLGLKPPTPEWGALLSVGKTYMADCWWVCTFPGLFIALAVLSINLMGDGLRDALDPKQKR